jgi:hypothetical protein
VTAVCVLSVFGVERCVWDRCDNAGNMIGICACLGLTGLHSLNMAINRVIRFSVRLLRYSQNIRVHKLACQRGDRN